ncbi:LOW QUALITY PROTEIN: hypothetical protein HID58_025033 [Brassica napus]|uniref:Replication protein A 70 kDa DNA-binding subunit B/D first OB fold domain-containing protein n=1 Tax=Brassica napus TaxID=3708 RepID=A0ABQ8CK16_BRANA|nr:LOW QUALITY PROTEIN: hypothetical protein HID58_025033 [Brassica napus]
MLTVQVSGELQVTNSFDASDVKINPSIPESDEYMKLLSQDDMSLTTTGLDVTKKKLRRKREVWLTYPVQTPYSDNNNNTKMLLLDSEAQKVVGCMAKQIWDGSYNELMTILLSFFYKMEDPELLPVEIAGAVGKTFHFGVQINKDNVSYGADTYKISKVWTLEELAKIEAEAAEADACETEEQESDEPVITMSSTKSSDKVEVKVLHLWTQQSNGDSLQFILADKTGVKIHATCKRPFFSRVQKLVVGQYIFIENFSLTAAAGNYRPTRHEYIILITKIVNGNLDSKFLIGNLQVFLFIIYMLPFIDIYLNIVYMVVDVIGHPIDIGNIQVVPVQGKETKNGHQIATCLWGLCAEHVLYAYKVGQVNQNFLCLLRFAKISVMPNDLTLTAAVPHVVKTIGNQRQPETWSLYPERTILEIIMSTKDETGELPVMLLDTIAEHILGVSAEVLLDGSLEEDSSVSIENAANTCFSSTPLSKRKVHNEIDDLSFTSKSRCSKIIKVKMNDGE